MFGVSIQIPFNSFPSICLSQKDVVLYYLPSSLSSLPSNTNYGLFEAGLTDKVRYTSTGYTHLVICISWRQKHLIYFPLKASSY